MLAHIVQVEQRLLLVLLVQKVLFQIQGKQLVLLVNQVEWLAQMERQQRSRLPQHAQ